MNGIKRNALNIIDGLGIAGLLILAQAAANYFG